MSYRRKVEILTELCTIIAGLQQPDCKYVPDESQESTESQLEHEMLQDEDIHSKYLHCYFCKFVGCDVAFTNRNFSNEKLKLEIILDFN